MRIILPVRQMANNQTLETLKKAIYKSISEAAPHIQAAKENQVKILGQKFSQFNDWYMRVTGLDKVHLAQEKVTALQNQLLQIQEKRRDVGRQLSEVRQKSMELQDEVHKVKRQDDLERFLDLMKRETEVLKLEKSISKTFQDYDQTERELFTAFTDSIRDSHEKQRAQMEYTKYFGIVLSITGSFLAFVYSTLRKEQLKSIIDERLQTLNSSDNQIFISELVQSNKRVIEEIVANKKALNELEKVVNYNFANMERSGNVAPLLISNEDNQSLVEGNYVKIFGLILGAWLLTKAFSG